MSKNWKKIKVSELVVKLTDYVANGSFKSLAENVEYQKIGYARLIRLVDYKNNFDENNSIWISKEAYDFLEKTKLFGGEIIINNVGEYAGTVFLAPKKLYPTSLAPNAIMLKTKGIDLFYYYYFKSPYGYKQIRSIVNSSGQPKFNKTNFKELLVPFPEIKLQNKISSILKLLDDKIELNNKINSELEAMAKTIYDYWFLQFEFPNEEGKPYKSSGGKMVWNEEVKREVPEGWEVRKLEDIFSFEKGRIPKILYPVYQEGLIPYITIDVANNNKAQFCDLENMILCKEEVIMVMDGAASGDIYIGNTGAIGSTFSVLRIKRDDISNSLLYCLLNSLKGIYKKVNTGSTVPHANKKYIESMYIPLAKNMEKFSKTFENFYVEIIKNRRENQELTSLRDFLLPLLMNGQVGFKEEK